MIDVTTAIMGARSYFESVFSMESLRNIRLEEASLSDDDRFWMVTFGFERSELGGTFWRKDYKMVKVDASSGQARGVQIREVA